MGQSTKMNLTKSLRRDIDLQRVFIDARQHSDVQNSLALET